MTEETVNLLMKYLEVHSQTFEASVSVPKTNKPKKHTGQIYKSFFTIINFNMTKKQKCYK